ncbi:CHAP domain-containing protein [Telmatospirillum siberiense]|uniref:CHAP domain-containing protein n=1 Tax=Telmatospirillum siberiense TaxID=382514 RepID=UPI001F52CEEA|nr:CHAP domain-containing protein [Telmatospirillum siberiense]
MVAPPVATTAPPAAEAPSIGGYVGGMVPIECAPFARSVSGVNLRGDAADWWQAAAGRYVRTSTPVVGAVLAFRRTSRLPSGHAAVVSRLVSDREIRVTQANWVPHRVTEDMPVIDISPDNDWTMVRVWWPPIGQLGSGHFPTWGFITPEHPSTRERLIVAMQETIRSVLGSY